MKHTYKIIVAVLLVIALAIPAYATGNDTLPISGKYQFAETTKVPDIYNTKTFVPCETTFIRASDNKSVTVAGFRLTGSSNNVSLGSASSSAVFLYQDGVITNLVKDNVVDFGDSPQYIPIDLYNWITEYAVPYTEICDGTSCPANDANADDICDDCGRTLRLVNTEYPDLPVVNGAYKHSVLSHASSGRYDYSVFVSGISFTARGDRSDTYSVSFSSPVTIYRFSSSNGGEWVLNVDGASNNTFTVGSTGYLEIIESTFSWYDENGDPFFPPPLWVEMGQVTQGEMGTLTNQTMETVTILVLCGVGCLALLILLNLLARKSQIFHL